MDAGARAPAPGDLGLVQAFVNTVDLEEGREELESPERLQAWLNQRGLTSGALDRADLRHAIDLREALRMLLFANNERVPAPGALETLDRFGKETCTHVRFAENGQARLESDGPGLTALVAKILAIVYSAMQDGTWSRLKACREDACRWAFYDQSRNRSGAWCSMTVCGNRTKTRTYRRKLSVHAS